MVVAAFSYCVCVCGVGLLDHVVILFVGGGGHPVLRSGCTILHFHQQHMGFSFLHILSNTVIFWGLKVAIPVDAKWELTVISIYISLMTNDVEHLFVCLLAICISPLEKCLFKFFAYFLIRIFFVFVVEL